MRVYRLPGIAQASNIRHCKNGYFGRTGGIFACSVADPQSFVSFQSVGVNYLV